MRSGDYELCIVNGLEAPDTGRVEMRHGAVYQLALFNHRIQHCEARVLIDGKEVGAWIVPGTDNLAINGPANEPGEFTFFRAGSLEASAIALPDSRESGIVSVWFVPAFERNYGLAAAMPHDEDEGGVTGLTGNSERKPGLSSRYERWNMEGGVLIELRLIAEPVPDASYEPLLYRIIHCPMCKRQSRIPQDVGPARVMCPHCAERFSVGLSAEIQNAFVLETETKSTGQVQPAQGIQWEQVEDRPSEPQKPSTASKREVLQLIALPEPRAEESVPTTRRDTPRRGAVDDVVRWLKGIFIAFAALALLFVFISIISIAFTERPKTEQAAALDPDPSRPQITPTPPDLTRILPNGAMLFRSPEHGGGRLSVYNGTRYDAVIKLRSTSGVAAIFAVSAESEFALTDLADGTYSVFYSTGIGWNDQVGRFEREAVYTHFMKSLTFEGRPKRQKTVAASPVPTQVLSLSVYSNPASPITQASEAEFLAP